MNKVVNSIEEAIKDIKDGMTLMFGGFGLCGLPEKGVEAVLKSGVKDLTCISCTAGVDDFGLGLLLQNNQVKKLIASYIGENDDAEKRLFAGDYELELVPQGTIAERARAGGAGIPAFYVPASYGTEAAEGKEVRDFDGKMYVMEKAFKADYAFVKAWKGDNNGNLIYKATSNNLNNPMAMCGKITIAEVEELVPAGELDPHHIHTPGIFIQHIFQGTEYEKRIEFLTLRDK
ncbi:MAG: CoA transferase subunit A [Candidatus Cloacimonetes bacterium]|jgi:3-oxoacid CoA-transferase subunit A|nr:CoA transferase subunit A [Candidatus Cloacimonadota bacterium]MBT5419538.1 CoA transferase subunit A [Candidatus Cloacimonadota bacterium]